MPKDANFALQAVAEARNSQQPQLTPLNPQHFSVLWKISSAYYLAECNSIPSEISG
jgi:hypothetical protein